MKKSVNKNRSIKAFTIVELLIVIVIIGILAAITIVSYTNITGKANQASLISDLTNAKKQFELYKVDHGEYPTGLNGDNCPTGSTAPNPDTKYCIKSSNGGSFTFTPGGGVTYELIVSGGGLAYSITNDTSPTSMTSPKTSWRQISAGRYHTCAINYENKAYCWGRNDKGQLGNNLTTNSPIPVAVDTSGILNGLTIKSISAGYEYNCAIASDNQAYCWGDNGNNGGAFGNGSYAGSNVPVAVDTSGALNGLTIKSIATGYYHTCAIASNDMAYCWGQNGNGALGDNSSTNSNIPVAVDTSGALNGGLTIKSIVVGYIHTCAIASNGQAYCWGSGNLGRLGNNTLNGSSTPVAVYTNGEINGLTLKSITAGNAYNCIIASNDQSYCWGYAYYGQLGNGTSTQSKVPLAVTNSGALNGLTVKSISAGQYQTCSIASNDQAYCWGDSSQGQLGNGLTSISYVPTSITNNGVLTSLSVKSISSGFFHTCAIASNNQAYCWGQNSSGELGNNSTTNSLVPVATQPPQ